MENSALDNDMDQNVLTSKIVSLWHARVEELNNRIPSNKIAKSNDDLHCNSVVAYVSYVLI